MTDIEKTEGCLIIAKYMGAVFAKGWSAESISPMYNFKTKPSHHPDHWHTSDFQVEYMLYHKSYDWLMPVLIKMSNKGYGYRIQNLRGSDFVCITKHAKHGDDGMVDVARSDDEDILKQECDCLEEIIFAVVVKALKQE
jgi:hypothetical protein